MTIEDAFTQFCQAIPIKRKEAKHVADALIESVFGCPLEIFSDQGGEFVNRTWNMQVVGDSEEGDASLQPEFQPGRTFPLNTEHSIPDIPRPGGSRVGEVVADVDLGIQL